MAFDNFPYTNFHELNADWMLQTLKTLKGNVEAAIQSIESVLGSLEQYNQRLSELEAGAVMYDTEQLLSENFKAQARQNIGAISTADIPDLSDVLRYTAQDLASAQKAQARENIGAVAATGLALADAGAVVYNAAQELTTAQKSRVRDNIGAAPADSYVKYASQSLTDAEKAQARTNIGAVGQADIPTIQGVVRFDQSQTLTGSQKIQARENIGAANAVTLAEVVDDLTLFGVLNVKITETAQGVYSFTPSYDDIVTKLSHGAPVIFNYNPYNSPVTYRGLAYHSGKFDDPTGNPVIFADLLASNDPLIVANSTGYHVYISYSNSTASIIVTGYEYRLMPPTSGLDAGKCLVVADNGTCSWKQITPIVNAVSGTTPTITPAAGNAYNCGELTSLTISTPPVTGEYSIVFTSGAAPTKISPVTILGLEDFTAEANTLYEINVLDNRAVIGSWAVSA